VTGATGYIGSRLSLHLIDTGWTVHALVRPVSDSARLPAAVVCHIYDQTAAGLGQVVAEAAPDVVFHLASRVQAEHDLVSLDALVAANIGLGAQLLEAMAAAGVRRLIEAGTYWEFDTDGHYQPNSFYAAAKHAFRALLDYYVQRHGFYATTLVLYDVYGPQDWRGKFLSQLINAIKRDEAMVATPGAQILDLVHVEDVARGFLVAAERLRCADAVSALHCYRLDSGRRIALRDVGALIARLSGRPERVLWGGRPYPSQQIMEPLSVGPRLPGWEPHVSLEDGFRMLLSEAGLVDDMQGASPE
jgi:nucleoside-diphosphate-sugar epimerase